MSDSELWSVALAADNIQTWTLDQLDSAYQRGLITENTLIWTDGMDAWQKLGEVLGEDEPAPAPPAPAPPAPAPPPVAQPVARAAGSAFPAVVATPAQPAAAPRQPSAVAAPQATARPRAAAAQPAPASLPPMSTAPVALNLDADLEMQSFTGGSKKAKWGLIAAAAVVVGGLGATAMNLSSGVADVDPARAAAAAQPLSPSDEPIAIPKAKDPDAPISGGGYKVSAAEEKKFKEEAKKEEELREKMAEVLANQPKEEKPRSKGGRTYRRPKKNNDSPIGKSGGKFDPLNGSLP